MHLNIFILPQTHLHTHIHTNAYTNTHLHIYNTNIHTSSHTTAHSNTSSFRTENKFKSHGKVCKIKDFCGIVMSSEKDNILEFNQCMKSDKKAYIIYGDIESLVLS